MQDKNVKSMTLLDSIHLLNPIIREYMDEFNGNKIAFINLCDLAWNWEGERRERERQFNQDNHKESDQSHNSISTDEVQGLISES
jgi:hypothetical protein